ncbi:MAG: hypothetical protein J4F29_08740 [Candidatus Latescibacteria bacterium]|nr:hypothetical protein [Candidatus Latescibacterota bacterium]
MKQEILAKICFSSELRDIWPTAFLTAEAHLTGTNEDAGPWSMRAELLDPPDQSGISLAWISFLSPKAPFTELPPLKPFKLTLGSTVVARCTIFVQPHCETPHQENDVANPVYKELLSRNTSTPPTLEIIETEDEEYRYFELSAESERRLREEFGSDVSTERVKVPHLVKDEFKKMHGELYPVVLECMFDKSISALTDLGGIRVLHNGQSIWEWIPDNATSPAPEKMFTVRKFSLGTEVQADRDQLYNRD